MNTLIRTFLSDPTLGCMVLGCFAVVGYLALVLCKERYHRQLRRLKDRYPRLRRIRFLRTISYRGA
jgi:hypothetical protein